MMRRRGWWLLFLALPLAAQLPPSGDIAAEDRTAFQQEVSRVETMLATAADKPTVTYGMARTWAAARQWPETIQWLRKAVALNAGLDPTTDRMFAPLRGTREFDEILRAVRESTSPVANSAIAFHVAEGDLVPESMAWDPASGSFFLGSTRKGKIVRCTRKGSCKSFATGLGSVLGIKVHVGALWALSNTESESALVRMDLRNPGKRVRYTVPGGGHTLNDLAITAGGDVYVTDTRKSSVWRLARGASELKRLDGVFPGANGIAVSDDDRLLYVSTFGDGIRVVDLAAERAAPIGRPAGIGLGTIDGLYFVNGSLLAIQNGVMTPRVVRFDLGPERMSITGAEVLERRNPLFEGITTGVVAGSDFYYVANVQDDERSKYNPLTVLKLPMRELPLDGVWKTQGYGYMFSIRGETLQAFEVTSTTCVAGFTARREPTAAVSYASRDGDRFVVLPGGSADHRLVQQEGAVSLLRMDRIPSLPAVCTPTTADTPEANFEVFARTWAEHYISFDLKHADWDATVAANRAKVNADTTPAQLFDLFQAMIEPFGDAHSFLEAPAMKREFSGRRPGSDRIFGGDPERFRASGMRRLLDVTDRAYLPGGTRKYCNGKIEYGHLDASTGYLRILSFSGYARRGGHAAGMEALVKALDEIFADPRLQALVIDVRINFGGSDAYGLEIANRLASAEYVAYTKHARSDPMDRNRWTPGDPSVVRPSGRPGFKGPGGGADRAGDHQRRRDVHAGVDGSHAARYPNRREHPGAFIPTCWVESSRTAGTSACRTRSTAPPLAPAFDGVGIGPDVAVEVFGDDDVKAGRDACLAKALELLRP